MGKTGKRIAIAGGVLLLVLVIGAAVVLGQLGRLIEKGVETVGPAITGTAVSLGSARVSLFSGEGALNDLRIGNPDGFSSDYAFDLGTVAISVDPESLAGDVIRIRSIVIDGPKLVAEFDARGRNNLGQILNHARSRAGRGQPAAETTPDGKPPRMIIEEFRFVNAEVRALAAPFKLDKTLTLRPVELRDIGARRGGVEAGELANQILRPIVSAAIRAARDEYIAARRAELEGKAKEKAAEKAGELLRGLVD